MLSVEGRVPTFNEVSSLQLRSLCNSLGLQRSFPEYLLLQRFLFEPWGHDQVPARPAYRSTIGDDHSPYEYSIAFGGQSVEMRLLLEAQGSPPNNRSNYAAAMQLTNRIVEVYSLDLSRLETVTDLMCPEDPPDPFSMWHAVGLRPGKQPAFKIYLNPNARGKSNALRLVSEVFERLGLQRAIPVLSHGLTWRGYGLDELGYLSLDLSNSPEARVKVYFSHHGVTCEELERFFAIAPTHQSGDITAFCRDMVGQDGPFVRKPVTSCLAFVIGHDEPTSATLHVPISHYADSDLVIAERVDRFLRKHHGGQSSYGDLIDKFPSRSLAFGTGVQSYTSFRREKGELRLTVYLSPGIYHSSTGQRLDGPAISGVHPTAANDHAEARARS